MEFAFDQALRPTILLYATILQCFVAVLTKLCPESGHVRAASQASSIICNKDGGQGSTAINLDPRT